jgi:CRP/FNR family cyclic AMP-dependent transcriptional regulator
MTTARSDPLKIPKGAIIFRQGDPGHEMFVITEGKVRVTLENGAYAQEVGSFGPGEFFGELSLMSGAPRTATARAEEDTVLLPIGRDVFAMMVGDDIEIVFRMMHRLGERLSRSNQPTQRLVERMGRIRVITHCLLRVERAGDFPVSMDTRHLAGELVAPIEDVMATAEDLAGRGAGSLEGSRWVFRDRGDVEKLLAVLETCARTETD